MRKGIRLILTGILVLGLTSQGVAGGMPEKRPKTLSSKEPMIMRAIPLESASASDSVNVIIFKIDLDVQKTTLTLKHDCESNLGVKLLPTTLSAQEYRIMIRRSNVGTWYVLSTNQKEEPWRFVIAGRFKLRGMAKLQGTEWFSEEKSVEVRFPTYTQIEGDSDVQRATDREWANTLEDCTPDPNRRRERGFWIRLNTTTNRYEHTSVVTGPWVGPDEGASISLGPRPADNPTDPAPNATGATYTVSSFHTHTPTAYRPVGRSVGPLPDDQAADRRDNVVGIVYDYIESPPGSGTIPSGHPENSPARRYHSGPPERSIP